MVPALSGQWSQRNTGADDRLPRKGGCWPVPRPYRSPSLQHSPSPTRASASHAWTTFPLGSKKVGPQLFRGAFPFIVSAIPSFSHILNLFSLPSPTLFSSQHPEVSSSKKACLGASLVAQWLRIRLPMQGTRVQALVREDPTCRGATKPVGHNY